MDSCTFLQIIPFFPFCLDSFPENPILPLANNLFCYLISQKHLPEFSLPFFLKNSNLLPFKGTHSIEIMELSSPQNLKHLCFFLVELHETILKMAFSIEIVLLIAKSWVKGQNSFTGTYLETLPKGYQYQIKASHLPALYFLIFLN